MNVTDEFAIEGAVRALRNGKRIVQDAIRLYEAGHFGSAYILGVIALENVGRGRWMYLFATNPILLSTKQPMFKKPMSLKSFKSGLQRDHERTLSDAVRTLQFRSSASTDDHFKSISETLPGSSERTEAVKKWKAFISKLFNKTTKSFHKNRTLRQYLEPNEGGTAWNDPQDLHQGDTFDLLVNVVSNLNLFASEVLGNSTAIALTDKLGFTQEIEAQLAPPATVPA